MNAYDIKYKSKLYVSLTKYCKNNPRYRNYRAAHMNGIFFKLQSRIWKEKNKNHKISNVKYKVYTLSEVS